jgi:hypothetical protein
MLVTLAVLMMPGLLLAQSSVVVEITSGTQSLSAADAAAAGFMCPCAAGTTFTTGSGGPWSNITFNFYSTPAVGTAPATNPEAFGTAYLLTQPYFGTPGSLGSSTPGYVAASTSISGGKHIFPTNVILNSNTQYWVYENGAGLVGSGTISAVNNSFPQVFISTTQSGALSNFFEGLDTFNYTVGGTPAVSGTCTVTLGPGGQSFGASGGNGTINVTAPTGCTWSAVSTASWITVNTGSGSGNGSISYHVSANAGPAQSSPINITTAVGNLSFMVYQVASSTTGYVVAGSFAQVARAGGWSMTFTFVNVGSTAAQMRLNFFADPNGSLLFLPLRFPQSPNGVGAILASTFEQTIQPGAELVINTTGPTTIAPNVGWAQLLTNGDITGFATFTDIVPISGANTLQDAVVPLQPPTASKYILPFDNTNGNATGVAVANLTTLPLTVTVNWTFTGGVGGPAPTHEMTTLNLPPLGHTSSYITQINSDTASQLGTMILSTPSPGQMGVLGLRFNSTGAVSTVPPLAP